MSFADDLHDKCLAEAAGVSVQAMRSVNVSANSLDAANKYIDTLHEAFIDDFLLANIYRVMKAAEAL